MVLVEERNKEKQAKKTSPWADFFKRMLKEKPVGSLGALIVLLLLLVAIFADFIAPYLPNESHLKDAMHAPSLNFWLGTDNLGRDLFSRIIYGARISLYVGLGASAVNVLVATIIGLISGYVGGWFDLIVQRFVDITLSIPSLVILITVIGILGAGLWQIILTMGIIGGILWTRVVRSAVISIRENIYMDAARAIGSSLWHMLGQHVFPNILPSMIIIFSVSIAGNILAEAGLSFLGLGIPPPAPDWGGMLANEGRSYMYQGWWLAVFPGLVLTIVVYGVNMWGDAVRDLLDPRLRGGVGRYGTVTKTKNQ